MQCIATPLRVRVSRGQEQQESFDWCFTTSFRIGRDAECEVRVVEHFVSRVHAEVSFEEGSWWVHDLASTNGTYVEGQRIQRARLEKNVILQLGQNGPMLQLALEDTGASGTGAPAATDQHAAGRAAPVVPERPARERAEREAERENVKSPSKTAKSDNAVGPYVEHYFRASGPAGEHTQMIRRAYVETKKKLVRKYTWIVATVLGLLAVVAIVAVVQYGHNKELVRAASAIFVEMKAQDLENARLRLALEEDGKRPAAALEQSGGRRRTAQYEVYIQELGIRRKLTPEEQVIHKMAVVFNESEFEIPAKFVREVREGIRYWQNQGRRDYTEATQRAEEQGYTKHIVTAMQHYGLPPQFFYLALQESMFDVRAVGPRTNYGYAKGMWQFMPATAERYGLHVGPLSAYRQYDQQDERHDFERSTDAAARYLLSIYGTLAQASGMLVMASYNWGEHRVAPKLDQLQGGPEEAFREAMADIPGDDTARSYWRFYGEYHDRMPEQTKDYVRKVFAAAVIGEDPRLFGFDLDNPLEKYVEVLDP